MRITSEILQEKWNSINFYEGGYVQIDSHSHLEWYVGYKGRKQKTMLIISHFEPELLPASQSVSVSKGLREDGRWTLSLTLMRSEQESVFTILCADIINYSQQELPEKDLLHLIEKRYKQWHRLMKYQSKPLMDEARRKGLFGELIFLCERIKSGFSALPAVQGWGGPDGIDQDFIYNDLWYEIKAVGIASETVKISSLEQLDNPNPGQLVVIRLDKCPPEKPGAATLTDQVDKTALLIKNDPEALVLFENKLLKYGYIDLPEYKEQRYYYTKKDIFNVDDCFPRMTEASVMPQITSVQYSISLSAIEDWKVEE